jgi:hypothetical protein
MFFCIKQLTQKNVFIVREDDDVILATLNNADKYDVGKKKRERKSFGMLFVEICLLKPKCIFSLIL